MLHGHIQTGRLFDNFLGLLGIGPNPMGEIVLSLIPRAFYLPPGVSLFGSISVLQTFLLTGAFLPSSQFNSSQQTLTENLLGAS